MTTKPRKAIGIIRVSETKGREGESFVSPSDQRDRIKAACERDGLKLLDIVEELDVSGGLPIERRAGLRRAIEAVEAGTADVVVAAYFDRLVRSLRVQDELLSRVERAGGQVLAVDVGRITNGSAGQWLSSTLLGAVHEYQRRTAAERSAEGQARAVARGVVPWARIPPGYHPTVVGHTSKGRPIQGPLEADPETAPVVADAFRRRAQGAPVAAVREYLAEHGIVRSYQGVQVMLSSRLYLGEIHFGELVNLSAHPAIIDTATWRKVQRMRTPRGRRPSSDRILARLGVLRCAGCGARMIVGTNGKNYPFYRCPPTGLCDRRASISAVAVEDLVSDAVRSALADAEGRASAESTVRDASTALDRAQADLDAALRTFAGFEDEAGARERLVELREARDHAQARVDELGGAGAVVTLNAATDWERLSLDARRELIKTVVARVEVRRGRGTDRVSVELFGE